MLKKKIKLISWWAARAIVLVLAALATPLVWLVSVMHEGRSSLYRTYREIGRAYTAITKDTKEQLGELNEQID